FPSSWQTSLVRARSVHERLGHRARKTQRPVRASSPLAGSLRLAAHSQATLQTVLFSSVFLFDDFPQRLQLLSGQVILLIFGIDEQQQNGLSGSRPIVNDPYTPTLSLSAEGPS